jgi:hypothetical protein
METLAGFCEWPDEPDAKGIYVCLICNQGHPRKSHRRCDAQRATLISKVKKLKQTYDESTARWKAAGKPMRSPDRVQELYNTFCNPPGNPCDHYVRRGPGIGKCALCGCSIKNKGQFLNKLARATDSCPDAPPKFTADIPAKAVDVYDLF